MADSTIRHQTSDIRHQTSDIRHQTSDIRHQTSDIRHPCVRLAPGGLCLPLRRIGFLPTSRHCSSHYDWAVVTNPAPEGGMHNPPSSNSQRFIPLSSTLLE